MRQKNIFIKQKQTQRFQNQTYGYQRKTLVVGINWEVGIGINTLLHKKKSISNKDLLYSTGKSIQYPAIAYIGKEPEEE